MKIIVTGGCGYIGSHTVISLIENGFEIIIVDDLSNSTMETLDRINLITGVYPVFYNVDLKDTNATFNFFKASVDVEAIIHFAAYKSVSDSVSKPIEYYKNNLFSLINVIDSAYKNGIKKLIFSSSATVYGQSNKLPINEACEIKKPFSPYGNTKKVSEEIIEDFSRAHSDFSAISLRYFNPIGAHESGKIGESPSGIPNNLMPYITQTAKGIRSELLVYGNDYNTPDGTPIRDYVHVTDVGDAHVASLKRLINDTQKKQYEIYNIGTGKGYSVLEIIDKFQDISKIKLNYRVVNRRSGDVPKLYTDTSFAKEKLNWVAKRDLTEMIKSSWNWEQNNI